ncbi:zinc finger protein 420-like [Achroia grisella]|uniref:zinc finger protein 420-like n=1 Tax=Achroia grisella TaxID=688607 RepID=UPI0027D20666|nr:zinc finger protein 420-like [Achroia grisella]
MFVSHENNCKKNFLKPNILRKKSKTAIRANVQGPCIPSDSQSAVTLATQETSDSILTDSFTGYNYDVPLEMPRTPIPLKLDTLLYDNVTTKLPDIKLEMEGNVSENNLSMSNYEDDHNQAVNVESFFNNGVTEAENVLMFNINPDKELRTLVVIDDESHVNSMYSEQNQDVLRNMVPLSSVSSIKHDPAQDMQPEASTTTPDQDLFQQLIATPVKFKCEAPNCNKEFRSEQKLKKHENIHKKDSGSAPRQITVECPVKKVLPDGTEQPCGKIYLVREQLVRHLNEDHTLEDASYRCSECGRQFFWASGLRAHARAHAVPRPPAALVCAWAGCGRQFRQPCRLREHARAHTGDRPYACPYPDCDWSFRSASKLERHARRHTGERRHECSACGRAFLRRDHLREHAARRHAHAAHRCTRLVVPVGARKLERHARRHTGERRHECSACGRAFLRRDHLREHAARRHAHAAHRCTHAGTDNATSAGARRATSRARSAPHADNARRRATSRARSAPLHARRYRQRDICGSTPRDVTRTQRTAARTQHAARRHAHAAHRCTHAGTDNATSAGARRATSRARSAPLHARRYRQRDICGSTPRDVTRTQRTAARTQVQTTRHLREHAARRHAHAAHRCTHAGTDNATSAGARRATSRARSAPLHARRYRQRDICGSTPRDVTRTQRTAARTQVQTTRHLREHAARRHAHAAHRCTHAGCKHVFSNTSSLYLHMKKVHRNQESEKTTPENADDPSLLKNNWDFIFLTVEGVEEPEASEGKALETEVESKPEPEMEAEVEAGRAARTHCPWPLQSRALHQYVMEEEGANVAQSVVEPSENSESNIYTVRSDLFLHGNVLINEDSEHMGAVCVPGAGPEAEPEPAADDRADHALGELGLLDAHPTIDLMQEELMYTVWQ